MLFKKNLTTKERAAAALAGLQRNAYAMSMLRSRLESRVNYILNQKSGGKSESYQELAKVLDLGKNGEMRLNDMSEKIEAARFLEEFIIIIDGAAASISEIKSDIQQLVPLAEMALQEMHDVIARVSIGGGISHELRQEIEPTILAEVSAAIAIEKENDTMVTASLTNVVVKNKGVASTSEEKEEEPEGVMI